MRARRVPYDERFPFAASVHPAGLGLLIGDEAGVGLFRLLERCPFALPAASPSAAITEASGSIAGLFLRLQQQLLGFQCCMPLGSECRHPPP